MKTALVGFTGFVGSNLSASFGFDGLYNSKNIADAYGTQPELLVYSGVRAEMFLANKDPDADYENILLAERNIAAIRPKKLVLISTVAVYETPRGVDELSPAGTGSTAYGKNRFALEKWSRENIDNCCIVRLPALFGKNLKKNFLYDYINYIPAMLSEQKFLELRSLYEQLSDYYSVQPNGFYRCRELSVNERAALKEVFASLGFSALNFTDSRSVYQFYDLSLLFGHICTALDNRLPLLNLTSEPVSVSELYTFLCGKTFENHLDKPPFDYDIKTVHSELFGGKDGYILSKDAQLDRIRNFVNSSNL